MKVDGAIQSLIQGVSQQPARTRFPGQCTLQENMSSNTVDGLKDRPPMEFIGDMFSSAAAVQYYDFELRGSHYIACYELGQVRVFDLAGTEYTVNETDSAFDYLDGAKLVSTTLSGITYVANTEKVITMLDDTAEYVQGSSIIFCLGANYGRTYQIVISYTVSGVDKTITVSYVAPNGGSASDTPKIATDYIITQLETALNADTDFVADGFVVVRQDDHLYITNTNSYTFTCSTSDGDAGVNLYACNNNSTSVSKIPAYAPQGYIVTIKSNTNADANDLYLTFICDETSSGSTPSLGDGFGLAGSWYEAVAPGIKYKLDETTMPHILTYDEDTNEFTFSVGGWFGRQVGDLDSNEDPSFISDTIRDISFFQGRLVFLSGINWIASRTDDALDFFLKTATSLLDDDPIDISSTAKNVKSLDRAVPFNRDMVVFSSDAQFIVFGRQAITPKNTSMVLTTTFESELNASPVAAGRNIFFAVNYGKYTGAREFFTEGSQDINDSRPITAHVPKYMTGKVQLMASTTNFNMLLVQTESSMKNLFVYEYIWENDQKAQASWSTWIFSQDAEYFFFVESVIYCVVKTGNNRSFMKIDMDSNYDEGVNYQILLDRKTKITGVNTTISDPWTDMPSSDDILIYQGNGCPNPGLRVLFTYADGTFTLDDDMQGGDVYMGIRYKRRYIPTMPFVRDKDGVKIGTGTLKVEKFLVNFRDSGVMNGLITSPYRDDVNVYWSGRVINSPANLVGEAPISSGKFICPIYDNADYTNFELWSDDVTPMNIMDIEWVGTYFKRGTRIPQGGAQ